MAHLHLISLDPPPSHLVSMWNASPVLPIRATCRLELHLLSWMTSKPQPARSCRVLTPFTGMSPFWCEVLVPLKCYIELVSNSDTLGMSLWSIYSDVGTITVQSCSLREESVVNTNLPNVDVHSYFSFYKKLS